MEKTAISWVLFFVIASSCVPFFSTMSGAEARTVPTSCSVRADCKDVQCVNGDAICFDGQCECLDIKQSKLADQNCSNVSECTWLACPDAKLICDNNGECRCIPDQNPHPQVEDHQCSKMADCMDVRCNLGPATCSAGGQCTCIG